MFVYLHLLLLGTASIFTVPALASDTGRHPVSSDIFKIFNRLFGRSDEVIERLLVNNEHLDHDAKMMILGDIEDELREGGMEELYMTCLECRTIVGLLRGFINQGLTFDQVRDEIVEICYDLAEDDGVRGDILCPGAIDRQGPHVYSILNETIYNTNYICQLYNNCPWEGRKLHQYTKHTKQKTNGNRNLRNLKENTLKVMHFTDIHIDEKYFTGAATDCNLPICCREDWNGTGSAGEWGDFRCNIPPRTLEHMMEQLNTLQPDVILYSGDSPPHALWEETLWSQLNVSRFVSNSFTNLMPGIPTYAAIGNHETYPTNLYYPLLAETQLFNEEFIHYWQDLGNLGEDQLETIRTSGYYSILQRPGLRIITYNTNYGYTMNFYNMLSLESEWYADMQQWLVAELQAARDNGELVLLNGHHPSGSSSTYIPHAQWMTDVMTEYGDIILLHVSGHHHDDFFRVAIDEDSGEARNVQYCGPTAGTKTNHNPTVRLFYLDEDTYELLDFENYYIDLNEAMARRQAPEVKLLYRATVEYGLDDLSPQSWLDLTYRFEDDQELFMKYVDNLKSRTSVPSDCLDSCKLKEICRCRTSSYDAYEECRGNTQI